MIHSAVQTTLCSLLRSDLVAELNQTVIDVQRTYSMMAEYNFFNSSCGRLNFISCRRKYSLFYNGAFMIVHFRSWEMVLPWNLNDSTAVTVLFMMVSGWRAGGFLLKSTIVSTVLSMLSSRLLRLHQTASSLTSCLLADSSSSWMADQCGVICKLQELDGGSLDLQSLVYREKSSGERTQP